MNDKQTEFIATSYDDAVLRAESAYECNSCMLSLELINENPPNVTVRAVPLEDPRPLEVGGYYFCYEPGGVYIERQRPLETAQPVVAQRILSHISRKGLPLTNNTLVGANVDKGISRIKVCEPWSDAVLSEDLLVKVDSEETQATICLLPADGGGEKLTHERALELINAAGVVYGINEDAIDNCLELGLYYEDVVVAKCKPPLIGKDGEMQFHFNTETHTRAPRILENDRLDYWNLDLFETVAEGQLLITRHPALPGEDGISVKKKPLPGKNGREANMIRGKGVTYNEDKTEMFSALDGRVELEKDRVVVSNLFTVDGNADMGVGNIEFQGDVVVKGNVISGLTITAAGNIEVYGVVESAELSAGNNIVLHRGIQGMDKGTLRAGGEVIAKFIERANVFAGGNILANNIIHSHVESSSSVLMEGNRASIMGGYTKAVDMIVARVIGSTSNTTTMVELGLPAESENRIQYLKDSIEEATPELAKLETLNASLSAKVSENEDDAQREVRLKVMRSKVQLAKVLGEYKTELEHLENLAAQATHGKVHVLDKAFPNTRVTIGNQVFTVDRLLEYATLKVKDREIAVMTCEYKKER